MVSAFGNSPLFVSSLSSLSAAFLLDFSETHLEIEYYVIFFCHFYIYKHCWMKGLNREAGFNFKIFDL